ncbi:hypothetical protein FN846DRAFT_988215 [Sphaerosporella brunnea]|uniref:Uncharacterized protein n=1 Tax=Sphaerosporella brunnea TaxID=1250544 RepID=A0A5J5ESZ6_9PEZI|nr:hypothetical protein FN846DRAFT_988215 [Sphaerosporella brunnea]
MMMRVESFLKWSFTVSTFIAATLSCSTARATFVLTSGWRLKKRVVKWSPIVAWGFPRRFTISSSICRTSLCLGANPNASLSSIQRTISFSSGAKVCSFWSASLAGRVRPERVFLWISQRSAMYMLYLRLWRLLLRKILECFGYSLLFLLRRCGIVRVVLIYCSGALRLDVITRAQQASHAQPPSTIWCQRRTARDNPTHFTE